MGNGKKRVMRLFREAKRIYRQVRPNETATGTVNGHGYVDLGLSVKWAVDNINGKFVWGGTSPRPYSEKDSGVTYGKSAGCIAGNPERDAARAIWGGAWRLPTKEEFEELVSKCRMSTVHSETEHNGGRDIYGYKFIAPNGNCIYIPTTIRWRGNSNSCSWEFNGDYYWSATPETEKPGYAFVLNLAYVHKIDMMPFSESCYVRPVLE